MKNPGSALWFPARCYQNMTHSTVQPKPACRIELAATSTFRGPVRDRPCESAPVRHSQVRRRRLITVPRAVRSKTRARVEAGSRRLPSRSATTPPCFARVLLPPSYAVSREEAEIENQCRDPMTCARAASARTGAVAKSDTLERRVRNRPIPRRPPVAKNGRRTRLFELIKDHPMLLGLLLTGAVLASASFGLSGGVWRRK